MTSFDIAGWTVVFLRLSGLLAVFPVFSSVNVPIRLRVGLGAITAFLVAPTLPAVDLPVGSLPAMVGVMLLEVGVGLVLGFVSRIIFHALELAGALISIEMGLSLPPSFNAMFGSQATAPGSILAHLGAFIWLTLNLHHWMLVGFQRSYSFFTPGSGVMSEFAVLEVMDRVGDMFVAGLLISAPVMAITFIISLVFSVLGRAVPQMNVFFESYALRAFSGLTIFGLTTHLASRHIANYLNRLPEDMLRVVYYLGGGT